MNSNKTKVCFLVSTNGGTLRFMHQCIKYGLIHDVEISVISNKSCKALEYAKKNNLKNYRIHYRIDDNRELLNLLDAYDFDVIFTTINRILDAEVVQKYYGSIINCHYSLLPAFKGMMGKQRITKAMQMAKFVGVTLHYVDVEVDSGKPIMQGLVKIREGSTESDVLNDVFQLGCITILDYLISNHAGITDIEMKPNYNEKKMIFSPETTFDPSVISEALWEDVKNTQM